MKKKFIISVAIIISGFAANSSAQTEESWKASLETIEKLIRPNVNVSEEKVPDYVLPDPLLTSDGRKVTGPRLWGKTRRHEILELFRENVYGRVPSTPYKKSFKVVNEDKNAMGGAAILKQVDITIEADGKSLVIHLNMFVPNKIQKPVPLFLLINNRDPENTDPSRKVRSEFWPAEEVIARGYGIAAFSNGDLDPDYDDGFKNGIHGLLDRGERQSDSWGAIAAWAWGASRCMDYFETDKDVDAKKIAILGHSRAGKTALWAGAEDERFALVISNQSGKGGLALVRRRFGENLGGYFWYCSNYGKYKNNEDALPVDAHMLISLIAPRAVYIASASEDLWADPKGSYLALYHAVPVFQLFEKGISLPEAVPPVNKQIISGKVAHHIRYGEHSLLLEDWVRFMDLQMWF
jgi:hypothetical protein